MSKLTCIVTVAGLTAVVSLLAATGVSADATRSVTFIEDVRPILETSCVKCHGDVEDKAELQLDHKELFLKGGLSGPVALSGNASNSLLIARVSLPAGADHLMPHKGAHLTPEQIETLTLWINAGMHWPDALVLRDRSAANTADAPTGNALKRYNLNRQLAPASSAVVDQLLQEDNRDRQGLVAAAPISDLAYLRKVSVDLIGRIPTEDEVHQYLDRPVEKRRTETLAALTQNNRLADRWTAFYADMLQIRSKSPGGKQLLAYVRQSVASGKPYDEMARELIAASGAPNVSPAVGFILEHNADPMALAGATSQSFLGVRLACAECHDHPFDKWSQQQFYDFAGWFGKTKRNNKSGDGYVLETDEDSVRWPPEGKAPESKRRPVPPQFLFGLETFTNPPSFLVRFEQKQQQRLAGLQKKSANDQLDGQLDSLLAAHDAPAPGMAGLNADLEAKAREDAGRWLQPGAVRAALAERITNPRNRFFARAFVNRLWAELLGHGFYEPVDDFRDDTIVSHPRALEYLSDEFVASGFDLASLLRLIVNTTAYQRGHLGATVAEPVRQQSIAAFVAAPWRRMPAESLYDSLVVAGHLSEYKWPAGANMKQIEEQVTYKVTITNNASSSQTMTNPTMEARMRALNASGYDLEDAGLLTFDSQAKHDAGEGNMAGMTDAMRQYAGREMDQQKQQDLPTKELYKTVTKTIDDNPKFSSAFRTESPAPPAHFLRIFGQPARERLGDFRDATPSMRQQLMMLNGRLVHEASRVGPGESLYHLLAGDRPQPEKAIIVAYTTTLTRVPTQAELTDALAVLQDSPTLMTGMEDLRWVLLNSDEFRYLP